MLMLGVLYYIAMFIGIIAIVFIILILVLTYNTLVLEYKGEKEKAEVRESFVLILFGLSGIGTLLLMLFFRASALQLFLMLIFIISSYIGWFAFMRFIFYLFKKENEKAKESFMSGVKVAPFFLGSIVLMFLNIAYQPRIDKSFRVARTYDICHDKEDWLVGGECSSRTLKVDDVVGKWQMLMNRDIKKGKYKEYYFTLKKSGEVSFHSYYVEEHIGSYDTIEYADINSTWKFYLQGKGLVSSSANSDNFHPYIIIKIDENSSMLFRFDSGKHSSELYLQNQYDDFDAPHYLTYRRVDSNGSVEK